MELNIPPQVTPLLERLWAAGYEAYVVGGCVRDSLLGLVPQDWDVASSARPSQLQALFGEDYPVLPTGLRHGTLTVLSGGVPVEITTYRVDGVYSDGRHPDEVRFTPSLEEDLARRDFTMNAMAYAPASGLVDCFGGQADLAAGLLRCVGVPERRFGEDALRILRGLRFASTLGLEVEQATAQAILQGAPLLSRVAAERVSSQVLPLLCGQNAPAVLHRFFPVLAAIFPELSPLSHREALRHRVLLMLGAVPPQPALRLAALFWEIGETSALAALARLRLEGGLLQEVRRLLGCREAVLEPTPASMRRWAHQLGVPALKQLLALRRGMALAAKAPLPLLAQLDEVDSLLAALVSQNQCFSLSTLAVNGRDFIAAGVPPGPALGRLLARLLDAVLDGTCPNEPAALLALAGCPPESVTKIMNNHKEKTL